MTQRLLLPAAIWLVFLCTTSGIFAVHALDAATGELVRKYPGTEKAFEIICIDGAPVFDGLSAAGDRVFVSCKDGSVICMGAVGK